MVTITPTVRPELEGKKSFGFKAHLEKKTRKKLRYNSLKEHDEQLRLVNEIEMNLERF